MNIISLYENHNDYIKKKYLLQGYLLGGVKIIKLVIY